MRIFHRPTLTWYLCCWGIQRIFLLKEGWHSYRHCGCELWHEYICGRYDNKGNTGGYSEIHEIPVEDPVGLSGAKWVACLHDTLLYIRRIDTWYATSAASPGNEEEQRFRFLLNYFAVCPQCLDSGEEWGLNVSAELFDTTPQMSEINWKSNPAKRMCFSFIRYGSWLQLIF